MEQEHNKYIVKYNNAMNEIPLESLSKNGV